MLRHTERSNRRTFERITIEAALAVVDATPEAGDRVSEMPLLSDDISPTGLFLRTSHPLSIGSEITVRLHLPTMTTPLACRAHVVRVERRPGGDVRGVGVEFLGIDDAQRQRLIEHLYRSYQIQHAGEP